MLIETPTQNQNLIPIRSLLKDQGLDQVKRSQLPQDRKGNIIPYLLPQMTVDHTTIVNSKQILQIKPVTVLQWNIETFMDKYQTFQATLKTQTDNSYSNQFYQLFDDHSLLTIYCISLLHDDEPIFVSSQVYKAFRKMIGITNVNHYI